MAEPECMDRSRRGKEVGHTVDFLLLVILVLDRGEVHDRVIREEESVWLEIAVACLEHSIEHGLVEEEVAHPFGNDNVILLDWQLSLL
jgi:hypothetical protein